MTMLALSTLVEERRTTQHALAARLRFEEQLSRFSGAFVQLPSDQMDRAFDSWLGRLADALGVDVLALFVAGDEQPNFRSVHFWGAPGFPAEPQLIAGRDFPWALEKLHDHQPFVIPDLDALPPDAVSDRATMERLGAAGRIRGAARRQAGISRRARVRVVHRAPLVRRPAGEREAGRRGARERALYASRRKTRCGRTSS